MASCALGSCGPRRGEAGGEGRGGGRPRLTIMFSRACLASQQFRNTGMNRFRSGGQNICGGDGSGRAGSAAPPPAGGSPTVMMKGSVLIISRMKATRKICSQMLPWGARGVGFRAGGRGGGQGGVQRRGAGEGRARPGGTYFVAEVSEERGLQEADGSHGDLGWGGAGASERGRGRQGPPEPCCLHSPEWPTEPSSSPPTGWGPWGEREVSPGPLLTTGCCLSWTEGSSLALRGAEGRREGEVPGERGPQGGA